MLKHLKNLSVVLLAIVMIAVGLPMSSLLSFAEENETNDLFQIVKEDPTALDWESDAVAYIDFSETIISSITEDTPGHGLTLLANVGATSWKAANRVSEDGYLLLGLEANTDGNDPEKLDVGNAYFKLNASKTEKGKKAFAIKIDYYGGGIAVDGGSYIDIAYNALRGTSTGRNTYGSDTYNTEKVETMYYTFPEADFAENIGNCGADFRLTTWNNAQLKIRRVSVVTYDALEIPKMKTLIKASGEESEPVASIDFSAFSELPLSGTVAGDGLTLITSQSTGNTRASNLLEDGYLLLGKKARQNDNPADMGTKPYVNGAVYIKLNASLVEKANTMYAVKIDYFGGGIGVDGGSYIDLRYNNTANNTNSNMRKTYGATYNSGEDQSLYYLVSNANFNETINGSTCGADFRLETWCGNGDTTGAQLKIKKISVVKYEKTPTDPALLFADAEADDVPEDTVFIDPNAGVNYGLTYDNGTKIVKIIDKEGKEHYAAQSVDYLTFKISDADVKAAQKVTLSISYWDIGTRGFSVQYNAETPDPLPPNTAESYYTYYSTSSFDMYDSKELLTLDIPIENAAFTGKQNGGADFRLRTMYIPDFYIERVALKIGVVDVTEYEPVDFPEMTETNNFKDKSIVGYQAWFQASDSKTGGWNHWNSGAAPEGGQQTFDIYPDVSDYPDSILHQTGYADLLNGQPAVLYDGTTEEAIDAQVKWMQEYGIDGFAVSRFYAGTSSVEIKARNKLDYMKEAAEKYNRLFYMGYDMSGIGGNGAAGIKRLESDFVLNVEKKYVPSPNYAQIDGKPVVSLWGFQGSEFNRYPNTENALSLIKWFHDRGYYVIGGCPDNNWARDNSDYAEVYRQIDMITPWT
ncbi:MAG: hypothetical protein IJT66_01050, partial [Clostridia bacterium]|nr:hypothetical protein [Clostridia bacterium]